MNTLNWDSSILGFGCMRLPTLKKGDSTVIDEENAIEQIRYGIDHGINYIDTAWPYHNNQSEVLVGKALQDGYREKVKLVTKAPVWEYKESGDFLKYLKLQLEKLQTAHLDIYLLHALNKMRFESLMKLNILKEAEKAKEMGLIKGLGFSFHGNYEVFKMILEAYSWDVTQIQFNYLDVDAQATEKGLKLAGKLNIPVVVMEPLRGGKLVRQTDENQQILSQASTQRSLADWAFQFVWNYPEVKLALSGMNTIEMLKENLESADRAKENTFQAQDFQIIEKLRDSFQSLMYVPCTRCEYCMPCPNGVNIPMNIMVLNESVWAGNINAHKVWFNGFAQTTEELKEKPNNGAAQLCINCGECLPKCPQNINIPEALEQTVELFVNGKNPKDLK